jgi:type I restriction enzyme R subunit
MKTQNIIVFYGVGNGKAIQEFFPNAQLFGFTGTPIFEQNATSQQRDGTQASFKTTKDIFQNELHNYTITNANTGNAQWRG